jgi:hypothetical protein
VIVKYRKHGLRMAEFWLGAPVVRPPDCDVLLLRQYPEVPKAAIIEPFNSLVLDLNLPEEELLQGLNRDTKYKVRRAENKDEVVCIHEPVASDELTHEFLGFYNEFAAGKGVTPLRLSELLARARAWVLQFSRAEYRGATVVWHVHAVTDDQATLLNSASHFRNLDDKEMRNAIGRGNRMLHWKDILAFKAEGKNVYDFGGWYAGQEDEALLRINQFKEGFGGHRVAQVNAKLALNWRSWVYLKLLHILSSEQRQTLQLKLRSWTGL